MVYSQVATRHKSLNTHEVHLQWTRASGAVARARGGSSPWSAGSGAAAALLPTSCRRFPRCRRRPEWRRRCSRCRRCHVALQGEWHPTGGRGGSSASEDLLCACKWRPRITSQFLALAHTALIVCTINQEDHRKYCWHRIGICLDL